MSGRHKRRDRRGHLGGKAPRSHLLGSGDLPEQRTRLPDGTYADLTADSAEDRRSRPYPAGARWGSGLRFRGRIGSIALLAAAVILIGAVVTVQTRQSRNGAHSSDGRAAQAPQRSGSAGTATGTATATPPRTPTPSPATTTRRPAAPKAPPRPPGSPDPTAGAENRRKPVPLFKLTGEVDADGPSGVRRSGFIGDRESRDSTGFWVGCDGEPAITRFDLNRSFRRLTMTLMLDTDILPRLQVDVALKADGRTLTEGTLERGETVPLDLSMSGVRTLAIEAQAVDGDDCGFSVEGLGIAFDATVRPA